MKKTQARIVRTLICATLLGLVTVASVSTASQAETGSVRVVFTKAGFIVGVGGGRGALTFRGHHYPFTVSGMSFGATIGASTNKMVVAKSCLWFTYTNCSCTLSSSSLETDRSGSPRSSRTFVRLVPSGTSAYRNGLI